MAPQSIRILLAKVSNSRAKTVATKKISTMNIDCMLLHGYLALQRQNPLTRPTTVFQQFYPVPFRIHLCILFPLKMVISNHTVKYDIAKDYALAIYSKCYTFTVIANVLFKLPNIFKHDGVSETIAQLKSLSKLGC